MDAKAFSGLLKEVRKQLELSQEDLIREIGVSFSTINRWENMKTFPSKLARLQFESYCKKMIKQNKLYLPSGY